jgi:succinyl-diaminopimelate desuccinylase
MILRPSENIPGMQLKEILESIESSRDEIADTMAAMVSIPSISPEAGGEGESKRADYLMTLLKGFDSVERVDVPFGPSKIPRSNILAKKNGKEKGTVWIIAHIDTVPAGDLKAWETDPFKGVRKGDRVYGRGTEDNGQSVISSLFASKFIEKGTLEGHSIGIAWVADEEMASEYGCVWLINHGYFSPDDIFMVPDWGSPGGSLIEVNEKNVLWLRFDVKGKSVHASTPQKGVNAFAAGAELVHALRSGLKEKYGKSDPMFIPPTSTFEPTETGPTVSNVNTVPGAWWFCMDCRILPCFTADEVKAEAGRIAAEVAKETGAEITVSELIRHVSGGASSTETATYKALSEAVESVTGKRPEVVGVGGGTCANFFRLKGYDAYVWQCGGGTLHGPNEYVELDNLITDAKVFATLFYNVCVKRA